MRMRLKKINLTLVFLATLLLSCASFASEKEPETLMQKEAETLKEIENYFNTIDTIESNFYQLSSNGATAEGKFYASKPNKMRLEYTPPYPVEVIADGYYLIFHDKKLEQVTYLDLEENPASMILKKDFSFEKENIEITNIENETGLLSVTLLKKDKPTAGSITLIFSQNPIALRQWQVVDAQQITTLVTLNKMDTNGEVDEKLFEFKDPYKSKTRRSR